MKKIVFFLFVIILISGIVPACHSKSFEKILHSELQLSLEELSINALIKVDLLPSNEPIDLKIILPFPISSKIAHFPSEATCAYEIIENKYTVISSIIPTNTSKCEISVRISNENLIKTEDDWRILEILFNLENLPIQIQMILGESYSINEFDLIKITFPSLLDSSKIIEYPIASKISDKTYTYNMTDILQKADGQLTIRYPVSSMYWIYEMIFSAIYAIVPSIGILKIKPNPKSKKRFYYLIPYCAVLAWAVFSTAMLVINGPTWDHLSKYYGGTILLALSMNYWLKYILLAKNKNDIEYI